MQRVKLYRLYLLILCVLSACSTPMPQAVLPSSEALSNTSSCCAGFQEFVFEDMPAGVMRTIKFNGSQPAYEFSSGKSYFQAYKLSQAMPGNFYLEVKSYVLNRKYAREDHYLFYPQFILLDADFNSLGYYDADYLVQSDWTRSYYGGNVIFGALERPAQYVIVLTNAAKIGKLLQYKIVEFEEDQEISVPFGHHGMVDVTFHIP